MNFRYKNVDAASNSPLPRNVAPPTVTKIKYYQSKAPVTIAHHIPGLQLIRHIVSKRHAMIQDNTNK